MKVDYVICTKILCAVYWSYIDPYAIPSLKYMDKQITSLCSSCK